MEKLLNGKAIYSPKCKAGEYAKYACNFYVGCSNDCAYCYCKRGILGHAMGAPKATLKKCFKDELDALEVFKKELNAHKEELQKHGLFFTFTSDPFIAETRELTIRAIDYAIDRAVPCKILTKRADISIPGTWHHYDHLRNRLAFGFTLTGHDELEPGASTNAERIATMRKLHNLGFKTFASIEPIVTLFESEMMIQMTLDCCNLYKIGLMSGKRPYSRDEVTLFCSRVDAMIAKRNSFVPLPSENPYNKPKVYWKDSVLEYIGMDRESICTCMFHVGADYNIFNK